MPRDPMAKKQRTSLADLPTGKSNRDVKTLAGIKKDVQDPKPITTRLNANVPTSLYNSFRRKAGAQGLSITQALTQILQRIEDGEIELYE